MGGSPDHGGVKKLALSLVMILGLSTPAFAEDTTTPPPSEPACTQPAPTPTSTTPTHGGVSLMSDGPCTRC